MTRLRVPMSTEDLYTYLSRKYNVPRPQVKRALYGFMYGNDTASDERIEEAFVNIMKRCRIPVKEDRECT